MDARSDHSDSALHSAAERGDVASLRAQLQHEQHVDQRDERGRTALMAATHANQPAAFALLLAAGADIDLQDDMQDTPFLYAGAEGLMEILVLANEAGADTSITNRYGGTALIPACERGHVDIVRYLLESSTVDIDHINRLGWTALLEAIILSDGGPAHQTIVELLLAHGANREIADAEGVTPLDHARARGYEKIVALLEAN